MGWLDGQVALVTGGGSGIGRGIVARFLVEGARVGVLERVPERIEQLKAAFGEDVLPVQGDVTRLADNKRAVEQTVGAFGQLDIFVGNAGSSTATSPSSISPRSSCARGLPCSSPFDPRTWPPPMCSWRPGKTRVP